MASEKHTNWEKINFIATYILAFIAVFTSYLAITSSEETADVLFLLKESLQNYTQPILKFDGVGWVHESKLDCENPPKGIIVHYKNISNIPIKIKEHNLKVFCSGELLSPPNNSEQNIPYQETITPAGETIGMTQVHRIAFRKYLLNKKQVLQPPFIELHFTAIISDINEMNIFKLEYIHYVGTDCNTYDVGSNIITVKQSISPIDNKIKYNM